MSLFFFSSTKCLIYFLFVFIFLSIFVIYMDMHILNATRIQCDHCKCFLYYKYILQMAHIGDNLYAANQNLTESFLTIFIGVLRFVYKLGFICKICTLKSHPRSPCDFVFSSWNFPVHSGIQLLCTVSMLVEQICLLVYSTHCSIHYSQTPEIQV